jgi:aspartyl protease family protein
VRNPVAALPALLALAACCGAQAQSVTLQGMMGARALVVIDGAAPKIMAAGETHQGVKVVSTSRDEAVFEYGGRRHTLRVGESPLTVGDPQAAPGRVGRIVLPVDSGGHFMAQGQINGKSVSFMVDTGATAVALPASMADNIGLAYKTGRQVPLGTANGTVAGWLVKLDSVRIGDVEILGVDAVVSPASMPFVLLGNSFLNRFQMKRDAAQMVLERRY